jgi:hypothetical protein
MQDVIVDLNHLISKQPIVRFWTGVQREILTQAFAEETGIIDQCELIVGRY